MVGVSAPPALEAFLVRTGAIDAVIEAAHEAEVERVQAAMAAGALALV